MSNQQNIIIQSEGTFTPEIEFGGASTGITYSSRSGSYVKTGNLINFSISITLSNKGSSTGTMTVNGLPFPNSDVAGQASVVTSFLILDGSYDTFKGQVPRNSSFVNILQEGSNIDPVAVDDTNFNNNTFLFISGAYFL